MRLEHLTEDDEDYWRGEFAQQNWIFGALKLSVTLPEFGGGTPSLREMHFGYYLQPLHLNADDRSEEHTSELQSLRHLVCRLLLEKKKNNKKHKYKTQQNYENVKTNIMNT